MICLFVSECFLSFWLIDLIDWLFFVLSAYRAWREDVRLL